MLQGQFGTVALSIVGDNEALNLFTVDNTGVIRTTQSLFSRSEASYTVSFTPIVNVTEHIYII